MIKFYPDESLNKEIDEFIYCDRTQRYIDEIVRTWDFEEQNAMEFYRVLLNAEEYLSQIIPSYVIGISELTRINYYSLFERSHYLVDLFVQLYLDFQGTDKLKLLYDEDNAFSFRECDISELLHKNEELSEQFKIFKNDKRYPDILYLVESNIYDNGIEINSVFPGFQLAVLLNKPFRNLLDSKYNDKQQKVTLDKYNCFYEKIFAINNQIFANISSDNLAIPNKIITKPPLIVNYSIAEKMFGLNSSSFLYKKIASLLFKYGESFEKYENKLDILIHMVCKQPNVFGKYHLLKYLFDVEYIPLNVIVEINGVNIKQTQAVNQINIEEKINYVINTLAVATPHIEKFFYFRLHFFEYLINQLLERKNINRSSICQLLGGIINFLDKQNKFYEFDEMGILVMDKILEGAESKGNKENNERIENEEKLLNKAYYSSDNKEGKLFSNINERVLKYI